MALLDTVKKIAAQTQDVSVPAAFLFGIVISASPFKVRVDSRFDISGEALVLMDGVNPSAGDKLVLLRNHGGQQFLVLGKR